MSVYRTGEDGTLEYSVGSGESARVEDPWSEIILAKHLNGAVDSTESLLNRGIARRELRPKLRALDYPYDYEGWLESKSIYKPEFFGSPSPRMVAVSGQAHFRETPHSWSDGVIFNPSACGGDWIGVPGLCTTMKLRHKSTVNINASFYAFEWGGVNLPVVAGEQIKLGASNGYENLLAGLIRLSVNGEPKLSTQRRLYTSLVGPRRFDYEGEESLGTGHLSTGGKAGKTNANGFLFFNMIGRHQYSMNLQITLGPGVHSVGVVFQPQQMTTKNYKMLTHYGFSDVVDKYGLTGDEWPYFQEHKHVLFTARNLVVDAYYNNRLPV